MFSNLTLSVKFVINQYFKIMIFEKYSEHTYNWFNTKIFFLQIFRNLFDLIWSLKSKVMKEIRKIRKRKKSLMSAMTSASSSSSGRKSCPKTANLFLLIAGVLLHQTSHRFFLLIALDLLLPFPPKALSQTPQGLQFFLPEFLHRRRRFLQLRPR